MVMAYKMTKIFKAFFIAFIVLCLQSQVVHAESPYVLPYPSAMPGSALYKVNLLKEKIQALWYFGDFGQYKYNLQQSDKYLVEAKTLFEYKQYLLGFNALRRSSDYFKEIKPPLFSAERGGKNIRDKIKLLRGASEKHIEVLSKMKNEVPEFVEWRPEKESSSKLDLWNLISQSIKLRQENL